MAITAPYYTTLEVQAILGTSSFTLHGWRARGVGPEFHKVDLAFRYPRSALRRYVRMVTRGGVNLGNMSTAERSKLFRSFHNPPKVEPADEANRELVERLDALELRLLAVQRALLSLRLKS